MSSGLLTGIGGVAELLSALLIFAFVLLATYLTTRFVGSFEKQKMSGKNLKVLEVIRLSGGKNLFLVRAGDKFLVLGDSKDRIVLLSELNGDSVVLPEDDPAGGQGTDFKKLLMKAGDAFHSKSDGK